MVQPPPSPRNPPTLRPPHVVCLVEPLTASPRIRIPVYLLVAFVLLEFATLWPVQSVVEDHNLNCCFLFAHIEFFQFFGWQKRRKWDNPIKFLYLADPKQVFTEFECVPSKKSLFIFQIDSNIKCIGGFGGFCTILLSVLFTVPFYLLFPRAFAHKLRSKWIKQIRGKS